MTRLALLLLVCAGACGRTITAPPEKACAWQTATAIVRNAAGDSLATATLKSYVCQ